MPALAPSDPSPTELLKSGLLAALVTALAALAFYGPGLASGAQLPFTHDVAGSDLWHMNLPIKAFYARELGAGRLPLWCPEIGTGMPLLAAAEVAALYPIDLLLFSTLPLPLAFDWSILASVLLAGGFAGALARELGAHRAACPLAGVVFALSGFMVTHLKHTAMTASAAWIPLVLLLCERLGRTGDRGSTGGGRGGGTVVLLALALACTVLAGHPQIVYDNLLVTLAWTAPLVLAAARAGGHRRALGLAGGVAWALVLSGLLAAPQLLPTRELNSVGPRQGGLSLEEATRWEYRWKHLTTFLAPAAFGDPGELREQPARDPATGEVARHPRTGEPLTMLVGFEPDPDHPSLYWEITAYVGLLPLALAAAALVLGRRNRRVRALGVLVGASLLVSLGRQGLLFPLLHRTLPGFDLFRFPSRFLVYVDLGLALLAALGLTRLLQGLGPRRRTAGVVAVLVLAVAFLDLRQALGDHNPTVDAGTWTEPPASARRILEGETGGEPFRILSTDPARGVFRNAYYRARGWKGDLTPYDPARTMLEPNLNLLFGLANLGLWSPLAPRWSAAVVGRALEPGGGAGRGAPTPIASLFNVRYLLDPLGAVPAGYPLVEEYPGDLRLQTPLLLPAGRYRIRLHSNPHALPRAFLVGAARVVADRPALATLTRPSFDPRREVLLAPGGEPSGAAELPPGEGGGEGDREPIAAPVTFLEYGPRAVVLALEAPRDCWLFLSDTHYPGWIATVDGERRPIRRANVAGRALRVPAGRHEVRFVYRPAAFRLGLWLAGLGLVGLVVTACWPRRLS